MGVIRNLQLARGEAVKATVAELVQLPGVWRGGELEHVAHPVVRHRACRASMRELPGGGWPMGTLSEVLHDGAGIGEVRFLAGALARAATDDRLIAWINPPYLPYAPALAQSGIALERCLVVRPAHREDALWAAEQALDRARAARCSSGSSRRGARRRVRVDAPPADGRARRATRWPCSFARTAAEKHSTPAHLRVLLTQEEGVLQVRIPKRRGPPLTRTRLRSMLWIALEFPVPRRSSSSSALALVAVAARRSPKAPRSARSWRARTRRRTEAGIREGQAVAAAKALAGELRVLERDPAAEREALERIAAWAGQFTPMACLDGAGHRARGRIEPASSSAATRKLTAAIRRGVRELGFHATLGVAPTPLAARLFARAEAHGLQRARLPRRSTELRERVADLPLFLLDWPEKTLARLTDLGVLRMRDVLAASAPKASRGASAPRSSPILERLMGRARRSAQALCAAAALPLAARAAGRSRWRRGAALSAEAPARASSKARCAGAAPACSSSRSGSSTAREARTRLDARLRLARARGRFHPRHRAREAGAPRAARRHARARPARRGAAALHAARIDVASRARGAGDRPRAPDRAPRRAPGKERVFGIAHRRRPPAREGLGKRRPTSDRPARSRQRLASRGPMSSAPHLAPPAPARSSRSEGQPSCRARSSSWPGPSASRRVVGRRGGAARLLRGRQSRAARRSGSTASTAIRRAGTCMGCSHDPRATPSCTASPTTASCAAPPIPRSSCIARPSWATRRSRSPTNARSRAWCARTWPRRRSKLKLIVGTEITLADGLKLVLLATTSAATRRCAS